MNFIQSLFDMLCMEVRFKSNDGTCFVEKHRKKEKDWQQLIIHEKKVGSVVFCSAFWVLSPFPLLDNGKQYFHLFKAY